MQNSVTRGPSLDQPDRIGIFGGTFDPIHVGHLIVAAQVKQTLQLSTILFVVAGEPWQKSPKRAVTPATIRFAMVQAATQSHSWMIPSRIEVDRVGPSYMVDTLGALGVGSDSEFVLIVGADTANDLGTWHEPERLASLCSLAVVGRPGFDRDTVPTYFRKQFVKTTQMDVSSESIRSRVASGCTIEFLVTEEVIRIVDDNHLYRAGTDD